MVKESLFALLAIVITSPTWAMDVVRDGKPQAEIIVAQDAHAGIKGAANDLQTYIEKISGAKLPIVNAPDGQFANHIYVGDNQHTEKIGYQLPNFTSSGYDILTGDNYTVLSGPNTFYPPLKYTRENLEEFQKFMGHKYGLWNFYAGSERFNGPLGMWNNEDIGPWHAVTALLERLGIRFYAPYEDGTIIPQKTTIVLDAGRETRQAAFARRHLQFGPIMETDVAGLTWLKHLKAGVRIPVVAHSNLRDLVMDPEILKKHPSWFAEESPGVLLAGAPNRGKIPRFTDPGFQAAVVDWLRKLFDTYPDVAQCTIGAPDSGGNPFDWRDVKKYQKPGMSHKQAYANMLWDFYSAVARELRKTHPDKMLVWWCLYNNAIPTNIDPTTQTHNIVARMRAIPASSYAIPEKQKQYFHDMHAMWAAFKPRAKTLQWEWSLDYAYDYLPRYPEYYMHSLQRVRQAQRQNFDGFFVEVPADRVPGTRNEGRIANVPMMHLMLYVSTQLMWNPDLDLDALLEEYNRLWFGPAAQEMAAFQKYAEQVWSRPGSRSVSEINGFLKPEDIPEYFRLLDAAKAKTEPGSLYFRRVAELEKSYEGLKTLFADRTPTGPWVNAAVVPNNAKADGNLSKYRGSWTSLPAKQGAPAARQSSTEFTTALSRDGEKLFVAVRCHEPNMKNLTVTARDFDRNGILKDDHVAIDLNTPERSWFTLAINPAPAIHDAAYDIELINQDALPLFWSAGARAHVNRYNDRWELEVMIPTEDMGSTGPSKDHPWGINVRRLRVAGQAPQEQALIASAKPSDWARLGRE